MKKRLKRRKTVMRASEQLLSRGSLIGAHGITFGSDRDLYEVLGYKRRLRLQDYRERYKRGGIAKRVVNAFPKATWRGEVELIEDSNPETLTAFETAWFELNDRLKVISVIKRADVLAGLGRYAVILIGAPGNLESPLPDSGEISFLQPFAEEEATITKLEENVRDPRFGQPIEYSLKRSQTIGSTVRTREPRLVHYTRVIHIPCDGPMDEEMFGDPRLEATWNYFDDLEKIAGGGAEAFFRNVKQALAVIVDKDVKMSQDKIDAMKEQAELLAHNMKRSIGLQGGDIKALNTTVTEFASNLTAILSLIAGTSEIPQRILLGSERGELASTQDRGNWADAVQDRRTQFAEPYALQPAVERFQAIGALPEVDAYDARWPDMENDDKERAELAKLYAEVNKANPDRVALANEIRDKALGWEPVDDAELVKPVTTVPRAAPEDQLAAAAARLINYPFRWRDRLHIGTFRASSKRIRWALKTGRKVEAPRRIA